MRCIVWIAVFVSMMANVAHAESYDSWKLRFRQVALRHGVAPHVFDGTFNGVSPDMRVVRLDRKQPERKKIGFQAYLHKVMDQSRIDRGRVMMSRYHGALASAGDAYNVPPQVIAALWGIETNYGANTGGFDIVRSLSTLAWEGRRRQFFENELLSALLILQGGHVDRASFKGSWAGAMGQNQFMPTSWDKFAVDADRDGTKDIWSSHADVFASSANYLRQNGWNSAYPWGWPVSFPVGANIAGGTRPLSEWIRAGAHFASGRIPNGQMATQARLLIPDGGNGRAYLVTSNFDTILTWNRSDYFALTVGILSDLIHATPSGMVEPHLNP